MADKKKPKKSVLARIKEMLKKLEIKLNPNNPTGKAVIEKNKRDKRYLSL